MIETRRLKNAFFFLQTICMFLKQIQKNYEAANLKDKSPRTNFLKLHNKVRMFVI